MVSAVLAAAAALATLAAAVVVIRARRARSERRLDVVLGQLDAHMSAISDTLQTVVERASEARARGVDDLELTVSLDELLRRIAAEAVSRTGAEAAAVRVEGPGGEPAHARFGGDETDLPDAPLAPGARRFRAVTVNWAYGPAAAGGGAYTSALVVPIVEGNVETGALAVYARVEGAFDAVDMRALEALAAESAPAIASARRFAEAERGLVDDATGVPDRRGYEIELERAVARARATGSPLSLLVLGLRALGGSDTPDDPALRELAGLLARMTRAGDVVCRRAPNELGVVLPETTNDAARRLYVRIREAAARTAFSSSGAPTFAAGVVEWRPNETSDSFDSRVASAVVHSELEGLELGSRTLGVPAKERGSGRGARERFQRRLADEIARARDLAQPLSLLVLDIGAAASRGAAAAGAPDVLSDVQAHVATSLGNRDASFRIGPEEVAVILPGSRAVEAEGVFAALQASFAEKRPDRVDRPAVTAGITELAAGDDPVSVLARAEHALERATQAGRGTVVVATAADDSRR